MRKSVYCIAATFTLSLAACGGGAEDGGADADADGTITQAEVMQEAAEGGDLAMLAGQWEQTINFTELDVPGVPANMQDMVARQMGGGITTTSCMTEQEINQPDPDFFGGEGQDNCTYDEFDRSGNTMTLRMTCDAGQGGTVNVAMDGEFSADSYTLAIDNTVSGTPMGDMTMKGTVTGRRIGDC